MSAHMQKVAMLSFVLISEFFSASPGFAYEIVAFKGLHQSVRRDVEIGKSDCTARLLNKETHSYLENTIPGIEAAFKLGATVGHFNIQRTSDGEVVALHDATLECRTNGKGKVRNSTLDDLKALDPGYGYTWDDGKTFPLRGVWTGSIPTLKEIVDAFPNHRFVINNKDSDPESINVLARAFQAYPEDIQQNFFYVGENGDEVRKSLSKLNVLVSKAQMKQCLKWWFATGWSGYIHPSCQNTTLIVPVGILQKAYFPASAFSRFARRANSQFWVLEVDTKEEAEFTDLLEPDNVGTYRIDQVIDVLRQ